MRDDAVTRPREHLHRPARVRVWRRSYALPKGQLARRGSCNVAAHPERLWPVRRITRRRWRRIAGRRGITRPRWWPVSRDWRVGVISRLQLGKLRLVELIGTIVGRRISAAEARSRPSAISARLMLTGVTRRRCRGTLIDCRWGRYRCSRRWWRVRPRSLRWPGRVRRQSWPSGIGARHTHRVPAWADHLCPAGGRKGDSRCYRDPR
jgi:hypothetical protein